VIRDHGDAVEADLAFRGIDLRDFYRPGSGLTPRRLWVLIRRLPGDAALWHEQAAAEQKKLDALTSVERLRERAAAYRAKGANVG
jgi:hypothetical protein